MCASAERASGTRRKTGRYALRAPTPLPPPHPGDGEECIFAEIREPERNTLAGYRRTGGYEALTRGFDNTHTTDVIETLKESNSQVEGVPDSQQA